MIDNCYIEAKRFLTEYMDVLHSCAKLLIEKERINREEFEALFLHRGDNSNLTKNEGDNTPILEV
jgi:cell division protease FtsH